MTNSATALSSPTPQSPIDPRVQRVEREVMYVLGFAEFERPASQFGSVAAWEASGIEHLRQEVGERAIGFITTSVAALRYLIAHHDEMELRLGHGLTPSIAS